MKSQAPFIRTTAWAHLYFCQGDSPAAGLIPNWKGRPLLTLLLFALLATACLAPAEVIVWTNASGGNWNGQLNWSPNQVPGPGDDAVITNSGTYTVALSVSASPTSLALGGVSGTQTMVIASSTLSLGAASAVGGNGVLELSGGTLSGAGTLNVSNVLNWTAGAMSGGGRTVIAPGATLNLANSAGVTLSTRTLENAGTVFCTGAGSLTGDPQAVLTNCSGGVWEVRTDRTFTWIGGSYPRFDNAGIFRKNQGAGTTTFSLFYFNNYGTVEVQSGTLHFSSSFNQAGTASVTNGAVLRLVGGGTAGGTFNVAAGGLLDWTGDYALNPGTQLNGDGLYRVSSGTLTLSSNADVAVRNLDLTGTLGVEGTLTVSNALNWTAGAMSGGGRTVIAPGATLNLANSAGVTLSTRMLENAGTVLCTGTGNLAGGPQTVLTNRAGGLWEVRNDQTFTWIGGTYPRFDNAGIFRKSQGTGTTTFSLFYFNNYGTVEVQSGTLHFGSTFNQTGLASMTNGAVLRLAGGGTAGGTFNVVAGGLLDWAGDYTLNPGTQLNGDGLYKVSSNSTLVLSTNADVAVRNLDLTGTLGVEGTLTVSNALNWTAGAMSGGGRTVIAPGATLNLANSAAVTLSTRTLENAGTVLWTGTADLRGGPQTVLTNRTGGLWEVRNDQTFTWIGGTYPRFDNAGIFRKNQGTGTTTFSLFTFVNYGTVEVRSGTLHFGSSFNQAGMASVSGDAVLRLVGGGTGSGVFESASGALVNWTGDYTLNPGAQLNGDGLYKVSSGTLTLSANADVAVRNLDLTGTLGVEGTLTVSNALNWTAGAMSGGGRTVIAPGATLNLANSAGVTLSTRTLENAGTVLCTGTGNLAGGPQTVLTNRAGGLWEVRNDQTFTWIGGTYPRFDNAGIFRKSQGTGTTTFSLFYFNNYGTLSVWQGTLSFASTLSLRDSGTVEFGLAGVSFPADYGRVNYGQPLQLTGRLAVVFRGGFVPGSGQQYLVMAAPILGTFQSYTAPTISPAIFLNPIYQPNAVQLVTTDATPSLSKFVNDSLRRFTLEIHGIASQFYVVEASTNFVAWTPLATNTMPASTVWRFVDADSVKFPCRFYRVRFLPQSAANDPTPILSKPVLDAQGRFGLGIRGIANRVYVVEASTNLAGWTPLETNTMPASTVWQFVDENSVQMPHRFYRGFVLP